MKRPCDGSCGLQKVKSCFSEQLESTGATLQASQWMNGTVIVDSTVGNDTLFLITWTLQPPQILLWDPSGKKQDGFVVDTDTKMAYLPIPGTAKVWTQHFPFSQFDKVTFL